MSTTTYEQLYRILQQMTPEQRSQVVNVEIVGENDCDWYQAEIRISGPGHKIVKEDQIALWIAITKSTHTSPSLIRLSTSEYCDRIGLKYRPVISRTQGYEEKKENEFLVETPTGWTAVNVWSRDKITCMTAVGRFARLIESYFASDRDCNDLYTLLHTIAGAAEAKTLNWERWYTALDVSSLCGVTIRNYDTLVPACTKLNDLL